MKYVSLEMIYNEVDPEEERHRVYEVFKISPNKIKTHQGDTTVLKAFKDFATTEQKQIIKFKMKQFDKNRIVVLSSGGVIDGNHHIVAAYNLKKPVFAIDLQKPIKAGSHKATKTASLYVKAKEEMRRTSKKMWYDEHGKEYELAMQQIHHMKAFEIIDEQYPEDADKVITNNATQYLLDNNWIRVWVHDPSKSGQIEIGSMTTNIADTILEIINKYKLLMIYFENNSNPKQDGDYDTEDFIRTCLK